MRYLLASLTLASLVACSGAHKQPVGPPPEYEDAPPPSWLKQQPNAAPAQPPPAEPVAPPATDGGVS